MFYFRLSEHYKMNKHIGYRITEDFIFQNCQLLKLMLVKLNIFSQNIQNGEYEEAFMMKMQWFEEHLQKEQIMELIEIWNNILYQIFGPASLFMPVLWIHHAISFVLPAH